MSATSLSPERLFRDISEFISQSHMLLNRGAIMELEGLDANVESLCAQVLAMSQEQRVEYGDKLQMLLQQLQELGATMSAHHAAIAEEIKGLPQHQKATIAYKTADATDGFGKRKEEQ